LATDTNQDLTLKEMQKCLDDYIQQFKVGYFSTEEQMLRLIEEVGELAREVSHASGVKPKKADEKEGSLPEELADVFVVTLLMANSLGIDLTEQFQKNMEKFQHRDKYRFERKDGKVHD